MITNQFEDGPLKRRLVTVLWSVTRWLWFLFTDIMAWAVSFLQLQRIACVFVQAHKNFGFVSLQILVPIHQDVHWCLAVINIRDKRIEYLDSLKGADDTVLQVLVSWPVAITTVTFLCLLHKCQSYVLILLFCKVRWKKDAREENCGLLPQEHAGPFTQFEGFWEVFRGDWVMMLILTQALVGFGNIEWQAWYLTEQNYKCGQEEGTGRFHVLNLWQGTHRFFVWFHYTL